MNVDYDLHDQSLEMADESLTIHATSSELHVGGGSLAECLESFLTIEEILFHVRRPLATGPNSRFLPEFSAKMQRVGTLPYV